MTNELALDRPSLIQDLQRIEAEQALLEDRWRKVADRLSQMDENGIGVRVEYDYDNGWMVETLNAGEWEIESNWSLLSEAIEDAIRMAQSMKVGLNINPYLPPNKYRQEL